MTDGNSCYLCDRPAFVQISARNIHAHAVECRRCGNYSLTDFGELAIRAGDDLHPKRWVLSALTRAATKRGDVLELNETNIPRLIEDAPIAQSPAEVADRVLLEFAN